VSDKVDILPILVYYILRLIYLKNKNKMSKKKQDNLTKALKISVIVVLAMAGIWLQSQIFSVLGDLQVTVFKDFQGKTTASEIAEDLPIPPVTIIEKHIVEKEIVVEQEPVTVYRNIAPKGEAPVPGSFAAEIQ